MTNVETVKKYIKLLTDVINSGLSFSEYCTKNNYNYTGYCNYVKKLSKEDSIIETLYKLCKHRKSDKDVEDIKESSVKNLLTDIPFDDIAQDTEWVRNDDGIIIGYKFNIARKVGGNLIGSLTRDQMDRLCSLYSRYGADLTAAQVSLDFPDYSLDELNRIKRAFLIYKYSCPFAPHMIDEHSEEELHNIAIERKKNNLTRTLEKNQLRDAQKINLLLAKENEELKNFKDYISNIKIDISGIEDIKFVNRPSTNTSLILNLSDMHIGAKVESNSLYENNWEEEDIHRRLINVINQIIGLNLNFDTIYLNMLGDMLDGMDNQTARRDHFMPQCMDNYKQFDVFFRQMIWFIKQLRGCCNKLQIYSVPNGNHTGAPEYFATIALQQALNNTDITMEVSNKFIGHWDIEGHCIILCHGKDPKFMKRPLPLHLDPNSIVWLNNYMDRENITSKYPAGKIHIFKGDLHSASYDSNLKFDYRNCLSLFGDSDYSQMNYNSNPRGCSYSLIINNNLINGEFVC